MARAAALLGALLAQQLLARSAPGGGGPSACEAGLEACTISEDPAQVWSEGEVEAEEEAEAAMMEVQLLQNKVQRRLVPVGASGQQAGSAAPPSAALHPSLVGRLSTSVEKDGTTSSASAADASDHSDGVVSLDHNGRVCMLCGKPLPERVGNRTYTEFRMDCGSRSSTTGPSATDLTVPAVAFAKPGDGGRLPMNGFCALNFAKSCADAVANRDYLYWPKSLDLSSEAMRTNAPWDARYCSLNGFLHKDVVALQHNFTGMRAKAQELCSTKYAKHGIEKLTFLDMMSKSRYEDKDAPTLHEAELLAAWNCAMGDLGCDMAMCAYSFCHQRQGALGLYGECAGWDPVSGMPV
mmetsp:Transcript_102726/g.306898  ORF Transcript_102726/g.306898 Transcript_102726/m.306898 type:complete len:352 (+) Transcript_102726:79-1134(+)